MGHFAATGDGTTITASQGLRFPGVVTIKLAATKSVSRLRNDTSMVTDQSALVRAEQPGTPGVEVLIDAQLGSKYELPGGQGAVAEFYRSAKSVLVRAQVHDGNASTLERYTTGKPRAQWTKKFTRQISGLAISKDGQYVAVALANGEALEKLVVVRGDTGAELWHATLKLSRLTSSGTDPMFFSNDGQHLVIRAGSKVQIRSASSGTINWRVDVGISVQDRFDVGLHAGFDGKHLWFFQYRAPRDRSHMLPSSGGGPVDICSYAVFHVERNRRVTETITAKDIDELLLGKHTGGRLCNVRAVLPLDDGGVLIVEYVAVDTLRIHRSARVPGS